MIKTIVSIFVFIGLPLLGWVLLSVIWTLAILDVLGLK